MPFGRRNNKDATHAQLQATNAQLGSETAAAARMKGGTSGGPKGGQSAPDAAGKQEAEANKDIAIAEVTATPVGGLPKSTSETKTESGQGSGSLSEDIDSDDFSKNRPNESQSNFEARQEAHMRTTFGKSGGNASTKIMIAGGIAVSVYAAILVAQYDATNARAKIESIIVEEFSPVVSGYKKVTVAFDRDDITRRTGAKLTTDAEKNAFNPCIGDAISFVDVDDLSDTKEYRIMKSNENSIELKIANANLTTFIGTNVLPYEYQADNDDYMDVFSSWSNQFADDIAGILNVIVAVAENVITQVVAPALGAAAGAAAGAASQGFCRVVPILCDGTIWIIIGMIFAGLFAFIILT